MARRERHVLVVEPDLLALHQIVTVLRRRDYVVATAITAPQASEWLAQWPIDVLVAPTQIFAARGVQFVVAERAKYPELAAILIGSEQERTLEMDARRHGFAFLVRPFDPEELLMVVAEQLAGIRRRQRWPRKHLGTYVPVRIAGQEARLRDVSYGGVGFELATDTGALPGYLNVHFVESRLELEGELIWSARGENGVSCRGGIALTEARLPAKAWRRFVDHVA
ncbi:MAG TPA: response regulator [Vicinamibacterales bacterium]|nr:response regulator [Vicinamibacterales bacterium]